MGREKVFVAKSKLEGLNPEVNIEVDNSFFDNKNGEELLSNTDIIIDATDNFKSREIIDQVSKKLNIPMIYGGLFRYEGQVSILNVNGSLGYKELFPNPRTKEEDSCVDAGVLGMIPGIIGNIQALEAVKLIVGINKNLIGKLLIYDGMNHQTQVIQL